MKPEASNPFYTLLLVFSVAFTVTAFAYALLPWQEQPAWFQSRGWQLLLVEVAAVIALGLASMGRDRLRMQRKVGITNQGSESPPA